mgnify:CR=1 FL=1
MAGLKELRTRIEAVKSTQKITSAMKMVAAARLRKAQIKIATSGNYHNAVETAVLRILADLRQEEIEKKVFHILPEMMWQKSKIKSALLLVFSSDKGLCGSYNSNINRKLMQKIADMDKKNVEVKVFCFGKKAYDFLKRRKPDILLGFMSDIAKKGPDFAESSKIAEKVAELYRGHNFDVCEAIFAEFKSAVNRKIKSSQLLPIKIDKSALSSAEPINKFGDAYYTFEPDRLKMLEKLLPILFIANIFDIIVQSQASEHGARMSSMDNATRNAKDMISGLTLKYNTIRQSAITTELIEIIAGAEAI